MGQNIVFALFYGIGTENEAFAMKKERDSGIELLRIFAILMVIGVHTFLYGSYYDCALDEGGMVAESAKYFRLYFRPAVNIFVIITGYFMARSAFDLKKSYKRVFSTYLVIYFYSIVLSLLTLRLGPAYYTIDGEVTSVWEIVLSMFFPMFSQQWYFLTDYILMCLLGPFVNIILQNITKKQFQWLLVLLTIILSIWMNISSIEMVEDVFRNYGYEDIVEGKNLFSFLYVYMIGGYIGMHVEVKKRPKIRYLLGIFLFTWMNYMVLVKFGDLINYDDISKYYSNPFVVLSSVCALMFFKDLHFHSRIINMFASTTIGIYALHEFKFNRQWIWNVFNFEKYDCSNLGVNIARIVVIMLLIFLVCSLIELVRQQLFRGVGSLFGVKRKTQRMLQEPTK